jgi:uncharacterized hydrophobic protein (TIGR00271 family)
MKLHGRLTNAQDRLAQLLGCQPASRSNVVSEMLHVGRDAAGYWLQLVVAVAIATLGLVLNSGAVVIGAMLIAPLMTPLVNLGMGLAVGSPLLVLRSSIRVIGSVVVALACSAIITRVLPFNELNPEIAARTTPTALDLFVAAFCAVTGVYAAMRQDSSVASTAAGTSIGISLVPPLCVSGYGIGTSNQAVASGASLLFLTNIVAIIVVSTASFAAAGFHQVDVRTLEAREFGGNGDSRLTRRLARVFASRGGPWLRVLMPLLLLASVYIPLRKGLDEVVWQIAARKGVHSVIARLTNRVVQSRVHVERGRIDLSLVVLGSSADAVQARTQIERAVQQETGIAPSVDVVAIPDAAAFASLEAALHRDTVRPPPAAAPITEITHSRRLVESLVARRWPSKTAGRVAAVSLLGGDSQLGLAVVHLGPALDPSAREILEAALTGDLGGPVKIVDRALPTARIRITDPDDPGLLARLGVLFDTARSVDGVSICVEQPETPPKVTAAGREPRAKEPRPAILDLLDHQPAVQYAPADEWSIRFSQGLCVEQAPGSAVEGASPSPSGAPATIVSGERRATTP